MQDKRTHSTQWDCNALKIVRSAMVGSLLAAGLVALGVLWVQSTDFFRTRPTPTALQIVIEACKVGYGVLLTLFLAAAALSLGVWLVLLLFRRRDQTALACTLALASPLIGLLTAALLLIANVRFLRFRLAAVSLVTDGVVLLLGLGLLLVVTRYLTRSTIVVRCLDSKVILWTGLAAVVAGIPLHMMASDDAGGPRESDATGRQEVEEPTKGFEANVRTSNERNVLLISIDTLRPDRLGAYGYDRAISPNIDLLARQGVLFNRAYSTAPWTLPAQMSMITGLLPSAHGAQLSPVFTTEVERLTDDKTTLAEVLQEHGYRTGAFTGGSFLGRKFGFAQGFDHMETGGELTRLWENAQKWLETDSERPFFMLLHTYEVHNYEPSAKFDEEWVRPVEPSTARRFSDRRKLRNFILTNGFFSLNEDELTFISDLYDATIAEADHTIGDILGYLRASNLEGSTVVIITSDHGEEFFEHGGTGHGFTFYEEMLRIPWILRFPGGPEGLRIEPRVQLIDVMPTILDLVGLRGPVGMQGAVLTDLILGSGSNSIADRPLIAEASHLGNARSILHEDAKLIRGNYLPSHLSRLDRLLYNLRQLIVRTDDLLFDLERDPNELSPGDPSDFEQGPWLEDLLQTHEALADEGDIASPDVQMLSEETIEDLRALGYLD